MPSFFDAPPPPEPPQQPPQPEWIGPPTNVLGAAVSLELLLARTDDAAVTLGHVLAYPNGFELRVRIRLRTPPDRHDPALFHPRAGGPEAFHFGVQFSDGRKATNQTFPAFDKPHEPPVLTMRGGGGGGQSWDWGFWVWGLPTPGPLTFVCEWPSQGLAETRSGVDAQPILDAAARAEELWPEGEPAAGGNSVSIDVIAFEKRDEDD
jgi:hypothetical protein